MVRPSTGLTSIDNIAGEHVIYIAQDGRIHQLGTTDEARGTGRIRISPALAGAPPAALDGVLISFDNQAEHVVFVGDDRRVYQLIYGPGSNTWSVQDLTASGGGPLATPWHGVDALVNSFGECVFYTSPAEPRSVITVAPPTGPRIL